MKNELTATVTKWTYSPIAERRAMLQAADLWDGNTYAARRWVELPEHIQRTITAACETQAAAELGGLQALRNEMERSTCLECGCSGYQHFEGCRSRRD